MVLSWEVGVMLMMLGMSLVRQWHGLVMQMQGFSHVEIFCIYIYIYVFAIPLCCV